MAERVAALKAAHFRTQIAIAELLNLEIDDPKQFPTLTKDRIRLSNQRTWRRVQNRNF